jgi:hypothetical protein
MQSRTCAPVGNTGGLPPLWQLLPSKGVWRAAVVWRV